MGCTSCSSGCGTKDKKTMNGVTGCRSNGTCGTGGCNKMNNFNWLANMDVPSQYSFDIVEVRFKNGRKDFYRNEHHLELYTGDAIIVEGNPGYGLGHVALQGELVRLQMLKKGVEEENPDIKNIWRLANEHDLNKYEQSQARDMPALYRTREIIREMSLKMKLSDVEFQADNSKATFYYSADERVDFRELIKVLASEFKIRVEMKQISLRQEAGLLGGIGSCGRELCCSTWLTSFKSVSTTAARYQNLSLNPSKLSGQCGRLKCCLNYELETYIDALKDIPEIETPLKTKKGEAHLRKTDIFRRVMWFAYNDETVWHPVEVKRVEKVLAMNQNNKTPESLLEDKAPDKNALELNGLGSILDENKRKKKKKKSNKRRIRKKRQNPE